MCLHWSIRYPAEEITRTPDSLILNIIICLYNPQRDTPIVMCLQEQGQQGVTSRDDTRHGKAAEGPVRQSALPAGGGGGGQLRRRRPVSAALSLSGSSQRWYTDFWEEHFSSCWMSGFERTFLLPAASPGSDPVTSRSVSSATDGHEKWPSKS